HRSHTAASRRTLTASAPTPPIAGAGCVTPPPTRGRGAYGWRSTGGCGARPAPAAAAHADNHCGQDGRNRLTERRLRAKLINLYFVSRAKRPACCGRRGRTPPEASLPGGAGAAGLHRPLDSISRIWALAPAVR